LSPGIKKFQSLEHAPSVSPHNEGRNYKAGSILSFFTFDQNTFVILECFVHKVENFIRYFLLLIKKNLFFIILPVEGEILHANAIPVVCELHAGSVDHPLDLVGNDEFEVLCPIFITNEETIFYLDHSN